VNNIAEVRDELRAWVAANWDPGLSLARWRELLADSGWASPAWPREWCGRDLPPAAAAVMAAVLAEEGVPGPPDGVGVALAAPVIIEYAPDELKQRLIRATVTGELTWCQLFSEPGAGSDLAGLATRAIRDEPGGGWLVTGQKVWSTGAATADFGLLLARTDPGVPKHAGITCFALPMRQPGVEVRPLRQMNGHASFNEVFLDAARVPPGHMIGAPGAGWTVARATLARERRLAASRPAAGPAPKRTAPGGAASHQTAGEQPGRAWQEAIAERTAAAEPHKWYPQRAGRPDLVVPRAQAEGKAADPVVRQEIAKLIELAWSARWTADRAAAARAAGQPPGPEGSLGKLASTRIARQAARVHAMIGGAHAMLTGPDSPLGGVVAEIIQSVPAISIAGGTDEIQRTIIAERILGLPREPDTDRDVPFRSRLSGSRQAGGPDHS
jgi:alkylation response protein AidB-like acyl-CoA dehydrogenase